MTPQVCPNCDGNGDFYTDDVLRTCPSCDGKGIVWPPKDELPTWIPSIWPEYPPDPWWRPYSEPFWGPTYIGDVPNRYTTTIGDNTAQAGASGGLTAWH